MAAGHAREGRDRSAGAALAWFGLALAPWVLRGVAMADVGAAPAWADWRGFAADAGVAGVCLALLFWPARLSRGIALLGALLLTALHYANYETVRALRAVANLSDAEFLTDATFLGGSVLAASRPVLLVVLVLLGAIAVWRGFAALRVSSACVIGALGAVFVVFLSVADTDPRVENWRQVNVLTQNARWLAQPETASAGAPGELASVFPELMADLSGEQRFPASHGQHNVLLVVLEGVSGADLASAARAHGRHAARSMQRLDAVFASNVGYSTFVNHNRRTDRGLYSLLCGELPSLGQGLAKMTSAARRLDRRCLPERLRERGYETAYLQAAPLAFMSKDQFLPRAGFSSVSGTEYFKSYDLRTLWGVDDRTFFAGARNVIEELRARSEPWFLTLLTVGTHHPYVVPAAAGRGDGAAAAFEALDAAIGDFAAWLDSTGVLDDTLVLITSDEAAGLWPGTRDAVASDLTQNWGFLVALLPSREQALVRAPHAQSDVALSVLDYLDMGSSVDGLHGRSLLRRYADGRHLFFGNVNLHTLSALAPDGYLLHCRAAAGDCAGYDAFSGRLFAPTLRSVELRPELAAVAREVAAASRPDTGAPSLTLSLMHDGRFTVAARDWQLMHGTPLALGSGEWLEVEVEIRARGEGVAELEHVLRFPRSRDALRATLRLAAGESAVLHYTLVPGHPIARITCQTQARLLAGRELELDLRTRRAIVHRAGPPPASGLNVVRPAGEDSSAAEAIVVMPQDEIDRVARSMSGSASAPR